MKFTSVLLSFAALIFATCANAQDRLYTKDGGILEVKIKEVGTKTIVYKKWSNIEGPDFVIPKNDIERIKFQNGDEEYYGRKEPMQHGRLRDNVYDGAVYGKNILSFSPVHMTNTSPVGFGISYERVLDKNTILSFYFPVAYSFKTNNSSYSSSTGKYDKDKSSMLWLYPSLKIYPTGSTGIVRYSVGPMFAIGTGNRSYHRDVYDPITGLSNYQKVSEDLFVLGLLVNNSLNIQPTPKIHLGLELGIGIPYYSNEGDKGTYYYDNTYSDEPIVQFNFNIGYRF
ncbi:MAG TPA: hypothetical protein VL093_13760 [Flavipsychrobacter sp.]|jgi:hypothetical protein|nr:hypothetical protein [Flavipsychrobacter sp.]